LSSSAPEPATAESAESSSAAEAITAESANDYTTKQRSIKQFHNGLNQRYHRAQLPRIAIGL